VTASLSQPSSSICRDIFITSFIFQVHSRIIGLIERNVRRFIHRIDVITAIVTTCNDPFRFLSPRFVFRLETESRRVIISCGRFARRAIVIIENNFGSVAFPRQAGNIEVPCAFFRVTKRGGRDRKGRTDSSRGFLPRYARRNACAG